MPFEKVARAVRKLMTLAPSGIHNPSEWVVAYAKADALHEAEAAARVVTEEPRAAKEQGHAPRVVPARRDADRSKAPAKTWTPPRGDIISYHLRGRDRKKGREREREREREKEREREREKKRERDGERGREREREKEREGEERERGREG